MLAIATKSCLSHKNFQGVIAAPVNSMHKFQNIQADFPNVAFN